MRTVLFCPSCEMHQIAIGDKQRCIVCSHVKDRFILKKRCITEGCENVLLRNSEYVIHLDLAIENTLDEGITEDDVIEATRRIVQSITFEKNGVVCQTCLERLVGEAIADIGIPLLQGVAGERKRSEFEEDWS